MTTQRGHPTLSGRPGRSRIRAGWWWTAPVWEREVDASHAPPEVRSPLPLSLYSLPKFIFFRKETYCVHFQVHILFWVTISIDLHALMIKKQISFLILSVCFHSCLFKDPQCALIGQLTQA